MRFYWRRWKAWRLLTQRIAKACYATSDRCKSQVLFLGYLKHALYQSKLRCLWMEWRQQAFFQRLLVQARGVYVRNLLGACLAAFRQHADEMINARERKRENNRIQERVASLIMRQDDAMDHVAASEHTQNGTSLMATEPDSLSAVISDPTYQKQKTEKTKHPYMMVLRGQNKFKEKCDAMLKAWNSKLGDEQRSAIKKCRSDLKTWVSSQEGKELLEKQFKIITRDFYKPPLSVADVREQTLRSPALIGLSIMDGTVTSQLGITTEEFLRDLASIAVEIENRGLCISAKRFQDHWRHNKLTVIDAGPIFSELGFMHGASRMLPLAVMEEKTNATYNVMGPEGFKWKQYVSPASNVLLYHNVKTGEKIFDHTMDAKKLREIAEDAIYAKEEFRVRSIYFDRKRRAKERVLMDFAASFAQRSWRARATARKMIWIINTARQQKRRRAEEKIAEFVQTSFYKFAAMRKTGEILFVRYEKRKGADDRHSVVYFDHLTGKSSSSKPWVLRVLTKYLIGKEKYSLDDPIMKVELGERKDESTRSDGSTFIPDDLGVCAECMRCLPRFHCQACASKMCSKCFRQRHLPLLMESQHHAFEVIEDRLCTACMKNRALHMSINNGLCNSCLNRLTKR
jgi:hypothetical protein